MTFSRTWVCRAFWHECFLFQKTTFINIFPVGQNSSFAQGLTTQAALNVSADQERVVSILTPTGSLEVPVAKGNWTYSVQLIPLGRACIVQTRKVSFSEQVWCISKGECEMQGEESCSRGSRLSQKTRMYVMSWAWPCFNSPKIRDLVVGLV